MLKSSQPVSPVISPQISTVAGLSSQVRDNVRDRLNHAVSAPNRIPHVIAAGRASVPRASISNPLTASISQFSSLPGGRPMNHLHLDVQNTPGAKVDKVADAIQRYLGIKPRREPTADPLDEDSIARHPQQLNEAAGRWAQARYYQFAANGLERYQFQPEFRAWGGGLNLNIENEGQADVSAPAYGSPLAAGGRPASEVNTDLVFAAQKAVGAMKEMKSVPVERETVGPPLYFSASDPYFDPAYAAQNAVGYLREAMKNTGQVMIGKGSPANVPSDAFLEAVEDSRQTMEKLGPPPVKVGAPNPVDDELLDPDRAWITATVVGKGLEGEDYREEDKDGLARPYRPRSLDEAYRRVFRILDELEVGVLRPAHNSLSGKV